MVTTAMSTSPQYIAEVSRWPGVWACGSSLRNGVIIIIIIVVAEAARLRGAQMVSWTQQKHSLVQVPFPVVALASALPPASLRCLLIRVEAAPAGEVRAKNRRGPVKKAPQIS